jgi:hypothetical protein
VGSSRFQPPLCPDAAFDADALGAGAPCDAGGIEPSCTGAVFASGGGAVVPLRRGPGGGAFVAPAARGTGGVMPVGCAPPREPARRGGSGGNRRLHDPHTAASSAFSALQNGQNRISAPSRWMCRRQLRLSVPP